MRIIALAIFAITAVTLVSCSKNGPEVPMTETGTSLEGTVYFGDQKVPVAMVIVTQAGAGGGSASAFTDDEGNYKLTNAPTGLVKIAVNSEAGKGQMMGRSMAGTDPNAKGGKKATLPKMVELPKKYQDPETSGITTTTDKGVNKFDIKIPK